MEEGASQHSPLAQDTSTDPAISSYSVPFHQWKGAVRRSTCHTWLFLALCLYSCMRGSLLGSWALSSGGVGSRAALIRVAAQPCQQLDKHSWGWRGLGST